LVAEGFAPGVAEHVRMNGKEKLLKLYSSSKSFGDVQRWNIDAVNPRLWQ
jgi:hypothetical protein